MIVSLGDYEFLELEAVGGVLDELKYLHITCISIQKTLGGATLK